MAVSAVPYGAFLLGLGTGVFDLDSDTIRVLLTTSSYTPNVDTHDFVDDVTNEITGTGYTAGGMALTTVTWTYDSAENWAILSADPVIWTGASFTARRAVVYQDTGTDSTSALIGYVDFGADRSPNLSSEFIVNFTQGVVRLRQA